MQAAASSSTTTPGTERLLEPDQNKRIALPIRIEPKVFFANERTFLSWLNFTVVLGGLAIGLLNFGDRVSRMAAALFTMVAMGVMLYSLYTFLWRANKIRKREAAPYDDRIGPTVLCIVLILAVSFNFYCEYKYSFFIICIMELKSHPVRLGTDVWFTAFSLRISIGR